MSPRENLEAPCTAADGGRASLRDTPLEWVALDSKRVVIASEAGAALHVPSPFGADAFSAPMQHAGSSTTTFWLLEGAIAAAGLARRARVGEPPGASAAPLTAEHWAYRLAGYFHTTHATRRLLPRILRRFEDSGSRLLAGWTRDKLEAEARHDDLALADLDELGYRARELVAALLPARARAWVEQLEQIARDEHPVACVGYAHALERLALLRGSAEIAAIEAALPKSVRATRCTRTHSALGSDRAHVEHNVRVTAALTAAERACVARACHAAAWIYFDPAFDALPDTGTLSTALAPFRARHASRVEAFINQEQVGG
jgi:hypothetical protein